MNIEWDNADLIVEYLKKLGIKYIFGVPGGAIEPLYNALARNECRGGPKMIVARHEAGAAFMAEGYARETGNMGVCCATTGPGSTNLLTGVASAYVDNIPMLVITAQTSLPKFGKNALQESSCTAIDIVGIFGYCCRYNTLISHTEQVSSKLISAIMAANRAPGAPAHISIPADILRQKIQSNTHVRTERLMQDVLLIDMSAVKKLSDILSRTKRVALFLGKGCGPKIESIIEFAELIHAPMVTSPAGKRWINSYHPLYRGVYGFAGHKSAHETIQDSTIELLIAVGTPITELETNGWQDHLLNERLVHIDSVEEHFSRSPMAQLHVCGDIPLIFATLIQAIHQEEKQDRVQVIEDPVQKHYVDQQHSEEGSGYQIKLNDPVKCYSNAMPLKPQRVVTALSHGIPSSFRIHLDAGNTWAWFTHYYHRACSKGYYHIAMGFGSMGWAVGASIGNCLASGQPAVCITGDGSYLMSGQEITVALQQQLPVIYVVLNDHILGMVKHGQVLGGAEQIGFELPVVNYAKMAEAMGIEGITVSTPAQLDSINWKRLGEKHAPTMINMIIDPGEVPPMAQRVNSLATESTREEVSEAAF